MRYELKTIPIWPLIKITFALSLVGGFVLGLFYALFLGFWVSVLSKLAPLSGEEFNMDGASMGVLMIFLPFLFAVFGSVINTIMAIIVGFLYNLFAKIMGGLELELQLVPVAPAPAQPPVSQTFSSPAVPPPPPPVIPQRAVEVSPQETPAPTEPASLPPSEPSSPVPDEDRPENPNSNDSSNL